MEKGLPAKILLIPGILIVLILVVYVGFGRGLIPSEAEYQKGQARLAVAMKTKLPETPLLEVKYPIQGYRIPGVGGFCWIESSSGLIKYLEPDIDFDTFIFYGRSTLIVAGGGNNEIRGAGFSRGHALFVFG